MASLQRRIDAAVIAVAVSILFATTSVHLANAQATAPASTFRFQHVSTKVEGDTPEACFHFSAPLDGRAEAHYGDYVSVAPKLMPSLHAADNDLCLGGLAYGTDYKVTLRKGLPSRAGERTTSDETVTVSLGDRPPVVAISGDGFILPRAKGKGLAIETVNIDRVKIHVLRISDRLLPNRLHPSSSFFGPTVFTGQTITGFQLRSLIGDSASLVWAGTMAISAKPNHTVATAFPLGDIVKPGETGAYLVVAEAASRALPEALFRSGAPANNRDFSDYWRPVAAHWVLSTDIALTAISASDGLHIFARSLATADPLAGIKLSLVATGLDILGAGATGADGQFVFAPGLTRGTGASSASSLVAYGPHGDFAILDLTRAAFDLSDRGVSGRPAPGAIDAFLYTDRGIYRPGETVEAMTLLRGRAGEAVDNVALTLVLRRPDGVEAQRFALPARPEGGFHRPIALSRTAARGLWSIEAYVDPTGNPIGRVAFDVEDFVPQQLKVTIRATTPVLHPGQPIGAKVEGEYLYGAPAAGLSGEAELRITRDPNPVPDAKGYQFGLVEEKIDDQVQSLSLANADGQGTSTISDILKPPASVAAPLKAILSAGFFEPSGRIVKDQIELPIRTQPVLIGIKPRFADGHTEEGQDASFDIRVFDASGRPIARSNLEWRLIRENRVFDWFEGGGNGWTWHYHIVDDPVASGTLDVAERPAVLRRAVDWGFYRLVVDDPTTQVATSIRFEAGWLAAADTADTPDQVKIAVEKASYAPGETARIRVDSAYAGKAQLTIAGDRVFETRAVIVPKGGATFDVKVASGWGAGAYAVLSLYRPLDEGRARDPVRAVGVAWLGVDARPHTLQVAIGTPGKVTPQHRIVIPLKLSGAFGNGATYVTLAAVDEGILQLTRFQTPDPVDFFFGKRRLGVDIRDDYGKLLDNSAARGPIREGGDEAVGGAPLPVVSTRTVALFSGPVRVAANGTARVALDIPDFEGQLRLMAVAYNRQAVGEGESKLIVRDPVIADLSLPRFLAPGDTARLALQITNTDGAAGSYHLALAVTGAARLVADHTRDYALAAGERKRDSVTLEGRDAGVALIAADLTGPHGFAVHRSWQIAVRAAHYPITLEDTALQATGTSFRLDATKLKPFVPGSVTVSLGYSGFAGIDVPSLLQSLYQYPFGCTEQLSSTAFPLLYFKDTALLGRVPQKAAVTHRVQDAINTILDRQDAAGQFGLWRVGDGEASVWLNVYALDFLVHAEQAGYSVPDAALKRSYDWISQAVRQLDQQNQGAYAQRADATQAYAAYVLAHAGRADLGDLRRMHDAIVWGSAADGQVARASVLWNNDRRSNDFADPLSLGYLAGALALMGDHGRAVQTFALADANATDLDLNVYYRRYPRWWFDDFYATPIRDVAGLAAIAAESGERKLATDLVAQLARMPMRIDTLNTQEKAWLLRAAHALSAAGTSAGLTVNGREQKTATLPVALAPSTEAIEAGYEVVNTGSRDLWRTLVISGAPRVAPSAMAAGYTISKSYVSLDGKPVDPAHLQQNDRLIVSLSGRSDGADDRRSVLVDLLPAGWEIEAPITRESAYPFLGPLTKARMIEARDDRFVAAFDLGDSFNQDPYKFREKNSAEPSLGRHEYHLAYLVRVVTPGHFTLPEAEVEDMYRPGVMARTDAGETTDDPR